MSLDITIRQRGKEVYSSNFYGFIHFGDPDRRALADAHHPELVHDHKTYCDFVMGAVEPQRQQQYLSLVDEDGTIEVEIS